MLRQPSALPRFGITVLVVVLGIVVAPGQVRASTGKLSCSPSSLSYGDVVVGRSETLLVDVVNNGATKITISKIESPSSEFVISKLNMPKILGAGESFEMRVIFTPHATGSFSESITLVSNASDPSLHLSVGGSGVTSEEVTSSPASLSFGDVKVGTSATIQVVLTNNREADVKLTKLAVTGSAFSVDGARFPYTLAAGKTLTLKATFKPLAEGLTGGSAFIYGPALSISLKGVGTEGSDPKLTIAPTTLKFGNVGVGSSEKLTMGLTASGGKVIVSSIDSNSSQFVVDPTEFPLTIAAGKEASVNVTFTPKKDGAESGVLTIDSNANSPLSEPLTGTGTAPYVTLTWNASSSDVTGYNVYRSTLRTGKYMKINSSLDADTTYTDKTVAEGGTYYYETTAVNSKGEESAYSNWVEAVVP